MYLAATGAQRQHFPILGIYGFSVGYTSIISSISKTTTTTGKSSDLSADSGDDLNAVDDAPGVPAANKRKGKRSKNKRKRVRGPGLFSLLRDACMATGRAIAQSHLAGLTYDNINLL
ncbi:hypothetical protein B0H14DRAFT_3745883 [Mycena olivaceomarginata]|nr:hypothetical protein B0H14DRAFT_3745883 [Mycena olivaceomarginata]